jgi:hypothetical protein
MWRTKLSNLRRPRTGPVGAVDVVGPEWAIQIDPGLDGPHCVRVERNLFVPLVGQHLPKAALQGAKGERFGLEVPHTVCEVEIVDPAALDQRAVRDGHAVCIECSAEVGPLRLSRLLEIFQKSALSFDLRRYNEPVGGRFSGRF